MLELAQPRERRSRRDTGKPFAHEHCVHKLAVLELWSRLTKAYAPDGQPAIYRGKYSGWYCPRCEEFKDTRPLRPDERSYRYGDLDPRLPAGTSSSAPGTRR